MKGLINKVRDGHDLIFKGFLVICSLVAIVYLLPKEAKFKYEFQQGKPWLHSDLLSPFDFPILKTNEELEQETSAIKNSVLLHFTSDNKIGETQIEKFKEAVAIKLDSGNAESKRKWELFSKTGTSLLGEIYQKGVAKPDLKTEGLPASQLVVVINENVAQEEEFGDLLTISSAYDLIKPRLQYLDKSIQKELETYLLGFVSHNTFYDSVRTNQLLDARLEAILKVHGKIDKNELVISKGQMVTAEKYQELVSLKQEFERRKGGNQNGIMILLGQVLLVGLVLIVLVLFLSIFRQNIINVSNRVFFILVSFTATVALGMVPLYFPQVPLYLLPFCILPILIKAFYDEILAAFVHILAMLLIAFVAPNSFEFLYLQLTAGLMAIFSLVAIKKRSQLINTVLLVFGAYVLSDLAMLLMQEGDLNNINYDHIYWFGGSALLTILAVPLVYVFEKVFGFLSEVTLIELSDTNSPLLRQLATKAPGTFQHSLQVANLAEQAILKIGGNPLLVRTAAMYHDIGKMAEPQYFIENQVGGMNPHDDLAPEESARIIIDHVIKGIEMAKKHGLPEILIDFIRTHHGTSTVKYFLFKYREENGYDAPITKFQYPGPPPFSKETAVLMMADACEAASRSLKEYSAESIGNLVDNLINGQALDYQFDNADVTYKDITTIKKMFKKMLLNIYHVRIEYPK